jgi:hypothetical protein
LRPSTEDWKRAEEMIKISNILCKIAKDPKEYGLETYKRRIPDGVYVNMTEEGDFLVWGLAEAKLSQIDDRVLDQVDIRGSRLTIADIVTKVDEKISSGDSLEEYPDIVGLAKILNGRHLKINWEDMNGSSLPKMSLDILTPCDDNDPFKPVLRFSSPGVKRSYFDNVDKRVKEKPSSFKFGEIGRMTKFLVKIMNEPLS